MSLFLSIYLLIYVPDQQSGTFGDKVEVDTFAKTYSVLSQCGTDLDYVTSTNSS